MSESRRFALLLWTVAFLVLCNVALILTVWLKPGRQNGPGGETPRDMVIRSLKFSDEQVKQYDILIQAHQESMHRLRNEATKYRQTLFENLQNGNHNSATADSLAQLIANDQKQIEVVTYEHFAQVRKLCSAAQQVTFDQIIGDVTRKMGGPMHGPPGGPPPGRDERHGPPPPPQNR